MTAAKGVRWMQRFRNFRRALSRLRNAVSLSQERALTELESVGLIKAFEFTFELAWNTVRDFYMAQGEQNIQGSRDAFRLGHQRGLLKDGEHWMAMIESRGLTVHTYNEEIADEIAEEVIKVYFPLFEELERKLGESYTEPQGDLFKP
jgi:nucleotidyltransferase substrate binding protein (TIGR01987 family)